MTNRARPKCPDCGRAMAPLFVRRLHGRGYQRVPELFFCREHGRVARGRTKATYH